MGIDHYIASTAKVLLKGFIAIAVALLAGCAKPIVELYPPDDGRSDNKTIYIVNHGWHTGIVMRKKDADSYLPELYDFAGAEYLEIGWGDAAYYQAEKTTVAMTCRAALWPTDAVVHVVALPIDPATYFSTSTTSKVQRLQLSHKGFVKMVSFIADTFTLDSTHKTIGLGRGLYEKSRFYRAEGRFHLFNNCNSWTAEAIRASGFPISVSYAFTAGNIFYQLRYFGNTATH